MFDRSRPNLADGRRLEQADGTAWMGLVLPGHAGDRPGALAYPAGLRGDRHQVLRAFPGDLARDQRDRDEIGLWDPVDHFYYDVIRVEGGPPEHLKVRSFVGLIPLFATLVIEPGTLERLPHFRRRMEWYLTLPAHARRQPLLDDAARRRRPPAAGPGRPGQARGGRASHPRPGAVPLRLRPAVALASRLADEPFIFEGQRVAYEPAESAVADLRWQLQLARADLVPGQLPDDRGAAGVPPLLRYEPDRRDAARQRALRDARARSRPRSPGAWCGSSSVTPTGRRPVLGGVRLFQEDPHWRDHIPFHEYFHGDNGSGLGASHQTGWTSLVAELIEWGHAWSVARPGPWANSPGSPSLGSAKLIGSSRCPFDVAIEPKRSVLYRLT